MATRVTLLNDGWYWKERNPARGSVLQEVPRLPGGLQSGVQWTAAQSFPSEVHVELLKAGRIPDPFLGFNEHKVQWVGEREWLYYCSFQCDSRVDGADNVQLQFEGLDTICDVYLNLVKILSADNMFRTYAVPIDSCSMKPKDNKLLLHFKSTKLIAKKLEQQYGRVRAGSTNLGDPSRVYVRKAQYGWRWDWGPELMTCGPYRPISLTTYTVRISEVHTRATVSQAPGLLADRILGGDNFERGNLIDWDLDGVVQLWWPVGYGKQSLYALDIALMSEDSIVLDQHSKLIGFRRIQLVQEPLLEPDQHGGGTTFLFEVNGIRMFMGGSNWIPAHNFLTEVTPERYRAWLTLLRDGNQNMVRLWGGGVYEPDVFYDTCDELGILVWQDFQFACGVYPANERFVQSVKAEAEDNVKRLRHHPSLALFCGNNEDYQQILQWGGITELPARVVYEKVLPSIVADLTDPTIPYHPGSPYGGMGWDTADPTERPWQEYGSMGGRFVSEFGIPALPDIQTIDYWLGGNTKERWAQSKLMSQHNRAGNHERRFAIVMNENFRLTSDLETYVYNTQLMQSEAISLAYRMWRREWRGHWQTSGALVWQLNDCWPITSWAIMDFFLRPKMAYYTIARELAPITVGITRHANRLYTSNVQFYEFGAFQSIDARIEVWGANSLMEPRTLTFVLHCIDLNSDWANEQRFSMTLLPNQSTEILSIPCPSPPKVNSDYPSMNTSFSVVVAARLADMQTGEVVARYADWPQPYRFVDAPDPGLRVHLDGERLKVSVTRPVKGLFFSATGGDTQREVKWSDNALDVIPGDPQMVIASGISGRKKLTMAHFGQEIVTTV
ncbi:glycoside hydrolase family 2 protein [Laetiporus sulphureus 93-53]|uniref:beta-mannosidase n=1 Tax=Laetiporus sulphureus 93-53 TaxID=1314785 RepID=A0A165HWS4_9APHY|nr:glycoside hydrolase family 2 protein [Laetiporus sulphureus 93-53]KZT12292.1 glycoside hydrolase family 2 protein [Laetiporus sulphureus 93-53]